MTEIIEMLSDHFTISADDLPIEMFRQIPDPFPGCTIAIYFNDDGSMSGAWWKGIELPISHKSAKELDGMVGVYQDNSRQEAAEGGA
jgi:hypothetical protein